MNWDALKFLLELSVIAATGINTFVLFLRRPGEEAAQRVATLKSEMDEIHTAVRRDLAVLEERMSHMPTSEEMAELKGAVASVAESSRRMSTQLDRIESFLLNNK